MNIAGNFEARARLTAHGFDSVPAVCLDDDCVPGGDLQAIADLLSLDYTAPKVLTPDELFRKFTLVLDGAARFLNQVPLEGLSHKSPDRDRSFRNLGWHITMIPRAFVSAYDSGEFPGRLFREENVSLELSGSDL